MCLGVGKDTENSRMQDKKAELCIVPEAIDDIDTFRILQSKEILWWTTTVSF